MPSLVHKLRVAEKEIARLKGQTTGAAPTNASALALKIAGERIVSLELELKEVSTAAEGLQSKLARKANDLKASEEYCSRLEGELAIAEKALSDDAT